MSTYEDYEKVKAVLHRLPRVEHCTDQMIDEWAGRIWFYSFAGKWNDPLPKKQRELVQQSMRDLEAFDRIAAIDGTTSNAAEELRRELARYNHRVHLHKQRPKKCSAKLVTIAASGAFHAITGKPAPRGRINGRASGPLVDLVAALFLELEIAAVSGSQVKAMWDATE